MKKCTKIIKAAHSGRSKFGLPAEILKKGLECKFCANRCKISKGEIGYEMSDLGRTSKKLAQACFKVAKQAGLHLLV